VRCADADKPNIRRAARRLHAGRITSKLEPDMQIGVDTQRAVETKRAFIIDSDDIGATALQFMLADELEVHVLTTSSEALARAQGAALDVMLLGARALEGEGTAIVRALQAAFAGVPLVVYGPAGDASVAAALALGARSAIVRPFKVEAVRQKVNAQIGRRAVLTIPVVLG
jgi:DNA-binding NtrC family response regulator